MIHDKIKKHIVWTISDDDIRQAAKSEHVQYNGEFTAKELADIAERYKAKVYVILTRQEENYEPLNNNLLVFAIHEFLAEKNEEEQPHKKIILG